MVSRDHRINEARAADAIRCITKHDVNCILWAGTTFFCSGGGYLLHCVYFTKVADTRTGGYIRSIRQFVHFYCIEHSSDAWCLMPLSSAQRTENSMDLSGWFLSPQ